ncbi:hypothetical protein CRG98_048465 [Punica granatum]|uniref:Nudix hydrolase domain-containing protein n=1 Tax=Punica granatum TaxID=22663 RepID=A0A2I0HIJ0_PUNGR|nr:hypothetical protein CRG98_048465 [Punica granatum]
MEAQPPPQGYRRNAGICLINSSNKIFSASRLSHPEIWQMPQGGIDEGEDPKAAAFRELREETGVSSAEILAEVPYWLTYDFPPESRKELKIRWGTDYKGQAQKWQKPEFGKWSWMSPEQVLELVVDMKKPVYKEVLSFFAPYLQEQL